MAPEILSDARTYLYTTKSDVWSLGCTVLEMITGQPPLGSMLSEISGAAAFRLSQAPQKPTIPSGLPHNLRDLLDKCLELSPQIRPSTSELSTHPFLIETSEETDGISTTDNLVTSRNTMSGECSHQPEFAKLLPVVEEPRVISCELMACPCQRSGGPGTKLRDNDVENYIERLKADDSLESLSRHDVESLQTIYKLAWLDRVEELLKRPVFDDTSWISGGMQLEQTLGRLLSTVKTPDPDIVCVAIRVYVELLVRLYVEFRLGRLSKPNIQQIKSARKTVVSTVSSLIHNTPSIKDELVREGTFSDLLKDVFHALTKKTSIIKFKPKHSIAMDYLQLLHEGCQNNFANWDMKMEGPRIAVYISNLDSDLDRLTFFQYIGLQAPAHPQLYPIFDHLLETFWCEGEKKSWEIAMVTQITVNLLYKTDATVRYIEVQNINRGLNNMLERLHWNKDLYRTSLVSCLPLLHHQCDETRQVIQARSLPPEPVCSFHANLLQKFFRVKHLRLNNTAYISADAGLVLLFQGKFGADYGVNAKLVCGWITLGPDFRDDVHEKTAYKLDELDALLQLSKHPPHPNVVRLEAFQNVEEPVFYITEACLDGQFLDTFLQRRRNLRPKMTMTELIVKFALPFVEVIEWIQARGVVLRNLTARSLHVTNKGDVLKFYDFSAAVVPGDLHQGRMVYWGSRDDQVPMLWAARETLLSSEYSAASDVVMLIHTVLQILTMGCFPFHEHIHWETEYKILLVLMHGMEPQRPDCVPPELFVPLLSCLSAKPEDRQAATVTGILREAAGAFNNNSTPGQSERSTRQEYNPPAIPSNQPSSPEVGIPERLYPIFDILNGIIHHSEGPDLSEILNVEDEMPADGYPDDSPPDDCMEEFNPHDQTCTVRLYEQISERHMQLLLSLDHENLVNVERRIRREETYYLSEAVHRDQSLFDYARSLDPAVDPIQPLIGLLVQVAEALMYLHDKGLIHGNLRPENIHVSHCPLKVEVGHFGRTILCHQKSESGIVGRSSVRRDCHGDQNYKSFKLSIARYSPLEVNLLGTHSRLTDIASYGLVALAVFGAFYAKKDFLISRSHHYVPYPAVSPDQITNHQCKRIPPKTSPRMPDWQITLVDRCMQEPSHLRPSLQQIVSCLSSEHPEHHELLKKPGEGMLNRRKSDTSDSLYSYVKLPVSRSRSDLHDELGHLERRRLLISKEMQRTFPNRSLTRRVSRKLSVELKTYMVSSGAEGAEMSLPDVEEEPCLDVDSGEDDRESDYDRIKRIQNEERQNSQCEPIEEDPYRVTLLHTRQNQTEHVGIPWRQYPFRDRPLPDIPRATRPVSFPGPGHWFNEEGPLGAGMLPNWSPTSLDDKNISDVSAQLEGIHEQSEHQCSTQTDDTSEGHVSVDTSLSTLSGQSYPDTSDGPGNQELGTTSTETKIKTVEEQNADLPPLPPRNKRRLTPQRPVRQAQRRGEFLDPPPNKNLEVGTSALSVYF